MSDFFLDRMATIYANKVAIRSSNQTLTYAELSDLVSRYAALLNNQGISSGLRVVVLSDTSIESIIILLSLFRLGAIAVPLNTRLSPVEWEEQLNTIQAHRLWVSETFQSTVPTSIKITRIEPLKSGYDTHETPLPDYKGFEQPATLIFTSGSSGKPKAAMHRLSAHLLSAKGSNANIKLTQEDSWFLSLPLYHVGGLSILFRTLQAGASMFIASAAQSFEESLIGSGCTHISMVSTQLYRSLQHPEVLDQLKSFKSILLGGSAIPRSLIEKALECRLRIYTSYGSTEMASQITTTASYTLDELQTSGCLLPYRELKLSGDGEIMVKGQTCFEGFIHQQYLVQPFDDEGWYCTGDLGKLDDQNRLVVIGRKDNMFISGGENIQPEEIEQALKACPNIQDALVVPIPHSKFGHRPVAFVAFETPQLLNPSQLKDCLVKTLAKYKIPDVFLEMPADLYTNGIKPNRQKAKALAMRLITTQPSS